MMLVMRKKYVCLIAIAAVTAVGLTGAAGHYFGETRTFLPGEGRVIVIDAGHAAQTEYYICFTGQGRFT